MSMRYETPQEILESLEKIAKDLNVDPKKAARFYVMGMSHGLLNLDHKAILQAARKYMEE
ncbi:MAG: hypothetical protein FJ358_00855 [Thaumarchaeota archaeon]|nr:hypothetical protein [Nitrososphaerota archaeon]